MEKNGTNGHPFPANQLTVVSVTAGLSPVEGLVRVTLDIIPDEAYALSYRCTGSHFAGFAGLLDQSAFWARWGRTDALANRANHRLGIVPQTLASDPGE